MRFRRLSALVAALALGACAATERAPLAIPPLVVEGFGRASDASTLIIVLHAGEPARIETAFRFARGAAAAIPGSAAYAMLRPGFSDGRGKTSPGQPTPDTSD